MAAADVKVRVKMLTSIAGHPAYRSGDTVDLEPRIADAWIAEGYCSLVRDERPVERTVKQ